MANGTTSTKGGGLPKAPVTANEPVNNLKPIGWQGTINSSSEAKQWIKQNTTVDDPETAFDSIRKFTGFYSSDIREAQKDGDTTSVDGERGVHIEDYIKKAPQWNNSSDLHRGIGLDQSTVDSIIAGIPNGKSFDVNNSGTASWSMKYKTSESFASGATGGGKVPVIFRTKTMKNATPIMHLSSFSGENEVMSSKDNRFKPVKAVKKKINGKMGWLIDCEPI